MSEPAVNFEDLRLAALYEYDVLDSRPEESFDRITRLVKLTLGTPIAVVSLVDRDRQWFKSRQGAIALETPRSISFCTHTIEDNQPLIVRDALQDPRFRDSPLVTGENGIRFYVGVPLRTPSGFNIGALCAIDTKPRDVSSEQISVMQDLARLVVDELELRKLAAVDSLTGAMTSRAFALETKKEVAKARRHKREVGCIMLDLDHFKAINDTFGHAAGDQVLSSAAAICRSELRDGDVFGRVGGEEFAIVLPETSLTGTLETAERLRAHLASEPVIYAGIAISITASFGVTEFSNTEENFQATLKRADAALYQAKEMGRNRTISIPSNRSDAELGAVSGDESADRRLEDARSAA